MRVRIKIVTIITGLSAGGTESMLLKLLQQIDKKSFEFSVISLTTKGKIGKHIEVLGIPVYSMGMTRIPSPSKFYKLVKLLKRLKPRVVHTRLNHANLVGGIAARFAGTECISWGIHQSNISLKHNKLTTLFIIKICAWLSRWIPHRILSNSKHAKQVHVSAGFCEKKFYIIPNGFDLRKFKIDINARVSVRKELNLSVNSILVGLIGRNDIQKNHTGFLEAALEVSKYVDKAHFVLVGEGIDNKNLYLLEMVEKMNLGEKFHFLGFRNDIPKIMASLDILASTSHGEAFPNVLGEAMSCGVPCVVTDVGDCAEIIGNCGRVVAVKDMTGLGRQIVKLLQLNPMQKKILGEKARARINSKFEINSVVKCYQDFYMRLLEGEH